MYTDDLPVVPGYKSGKLITNVTGEGYNLVNYLRCMEQDHKLIADILASGSPGAYKTLVEKYQSSVFTVCFKILKNREEAEEVAQDVFVKCFRDLKKLRDHKKLPNWLMKIAYTRSIDRTRKKQLHTQEITPAVEVKFKNLETPYLEAARQNRLELLTLAINQLEPQEAAVISLFYLEDRSVKDIAEITSLGESNVKIKLFRARTKLRESIGNIFKDEDNL